MKKKILSVLSLLLSINCSNTFAQLTINNVQFSATATMFDKYEITFQTHQLVVPCDNPYDSDQYDYYAEFWSPTGKYYKVNAFYFNEVSHSDNCGWNDIETPGTYVPNPQTVELLPGKTMWKIRFTPNEKPSSDKWRFRIIAIEKCGLNIQNAVFPQGPKKKFCEFVVQSETQTKSINGFINIANKRYLKFDDGTPFYPVGDNAPFFTHQPYIMPGDPNFSEPGSCIIKETIDQMESHNQNFFVYDINFFFAQSLFGPDYRDGKNYHKFFNQKDSWQMDDIVEYAHVKGVYMQAGLFCHQDLGNNPTCFDKWTEFNPYYSGNTSYNVMANPSDQLGNCEFPTDFLTNVEAIKVQKNLVRYIIARWGYSNNIMSWSILDELNQFDVNNMVAPNTNLPSTLESDICHWHQDIKNHIKTVDPYDHIVTTGNMGVINKTSLNPNPNPNPNPQANECVNEKMDIVMSKYYQNIGIRDPADANPSYTQINYEAQAFNQMQDFTNFYYTKPNYRAEFGYFATQEVTNYINIDKKMYALHCRLWSSLFSGAMGPDCYWTHGDILALSDQGVGLKNFDGIGEFVKNNLPLLSEDYHAMRLFDSPFSHLNAYYLRNTNNDNFYGWVQDGNFEFEKLIQGVLGNNEIYHPYLDVIPLASARPNLSSTTSNSINIGVGRQGTYRVKWYNTEDGLEISNTLQNTSSNYLELEMPQGLRDNHFADAAFIVEYICDSKWNTTALNAGTPPNMLENSNLTTSINGNIYFVDINHKLSSMIYQGYLWEEGSMDNPYAGGSNLVREGSDIARGNYDQVFYVNEANKIGVYYWNINTNAWTTSPLCQSCNSGYTVRPDNIFSNDSPIECDNQGNVYYVAQDNKIHNYWYDLNTNLWNEGNLNGLNARNMALGTDIAVDDFGNIFYIDENNKISRQYWNNITQTWQSESISPGNIDVRLKSKITCDQNGNVYFVKNTGPQGKIVRLVRTSPSTWSYEDFATGQYILDNTIAFNSELVVSSNGQIFYTDIYDRTCNYNTDGINWYEGILNYDAPNHCGTHLTKDANNNIYYAPLGVSHRVWVHYWDCNEQFRSPNHISTDMPNQISSKSLTSLSVYPSPNNGDFKVALNLGEINKTISYRIINIYGQEMLVVNNKYISDNNAILEISLKDCNSGVYFFQLMDGPHSKTTKFNLIKE
jgi:hypothetical protein